MEQKNFILRNEQEVNVIVTRILLWSLFAFPIMLLLCKPFLGVFNASVNEVIYPSLLGVICHFLPYLMRKLRVSSTGVKYTAITMSAISIGIINANPFLWISIILIFPVLLSLLYFDKRLTFFAVLITLAGMFASQYSFDYYRGILGTLPGNFPVMRQYLLDVITYLLEIGIVALISTMLTRRTRNLLETMTNIVNALSEDAQQVAATSIQLASSAQQLSEGTAEQASAIEETSSTLQESSSMLQQNTDNTKQAAGLSEQAKESANKGSNEMKEMMSSIQEIKKSSDQISKIIKVIDDIAFQTNILALNAAVEAARAGEAGAGFAVVAEEVRNLAQRSAQAAEDTTTIIESNIELSAKGVMVAEKVREALQEITAHTNKVNQLMDEVAAASQEQSQGVEQITKALTQMETITQQNAVNAEESASMAEKLNAQANSMRKIVQRAFEISN